jgi:hypothetical protein
LEDEKRKKPLVGHGGTLHPYSQHLGNRGTKIKSLRPTWATMRPCLKKQILKICLKWEDHSSRPAQAKRAHETLSQKEVTYCDTCHSGEAWRLRGMKDHGSGQKCEALSEK